MPLAQPTTSIRIRRATASQWAASNPVLRPGEPGFEVDTQQMKLGDGVAAWNSLPYVKAFGGTGTGLPGGAQIGQTIMFTALGPAWVWPSDVLPGPTPEEPPTPPTGFRVVWAGQLTGQPGKTYFDNLGIWRCSQHNADQPWHTAPVAEDAAVPSQNTFNSAISGILSYGFPMHMLDWEGFWHMWPGDNATPVNNTQVDTNVAKWVLSAQRHKQALLDHGGSSLEWGFYAVLPYNVHYHYLDDPGENGQTLARVRAINQKLVDAGLLNYVNYLIPECYNYSVDNLDEWEAMTRAKVAEMRTQAPGKPVYPILWPRHHDGSVYGVLVTVPQWRRMLDVVLEIADGVLIWDHSSVPEFWVSSWSGDGSIAAHWAEVLDWMSDNELGAYGEGGGGGGGGTTRYNLFDNSENQTISPFYAPNGLGQLAARTDSPPTGVATYYRLSGAGSSEGILGVSYTGARTLSFFAKAGTVSTLKVWRVADGGADILTINLGAGSVGANSVNAAIEAVGSWYRVSLEVDAEEHGDVEIYHEGAGSGNYVDIGGFQLQTGSLSAYQRTVNGAVV